MRYALAGMVAIVGLALVGLAYHDTVTQAWQVLRGQGASSNAQK